MRKLRTSLDRPITRDLSSRLTRRDQQMLQIAAQQATKSSMRYRVGAVITTSIGAIVGAGHNRRYSPPPYRSTPAGYLYHYSIHAELDAIQKLPSWLQKQRLTLYVYAITPGGNLTKSSPCYTCSTLLIANGIQRVVTPPTPQHYLQATGDLHAL